MDWNLDALCDDGEVRPVTRFAKPECVIQSIAANRSASTRTEANLNSRLARPSRAESILQHILP